MDYLTDGNVIDERCHDVNVVSRDSTYQRDGEGSLSLVEMVAELEGLCLHTAHTQTLKY